MNAVIRSLLHQIAAPLALTLMLANSERNLMAQEPSAISPKPKDPRYDVFKRRMFPLIGRRVTLKGFVQPGKFGWALICNDWTIYIYPPKDLSKLDKIDPFGGREIGVSGILKFDAGFVGSKEKVGTLEHFYLEEEDTTVSPVKD